MLAEDGNRSTSSEEKCPALSATMMTCSLFGLYIYILNKEKARDIEKPSEKREAEKEKVTEWQGIASIDCLYA